MPTYFEYALKTSFCLATVFLFYFLLLKRMTFYSWNRHFLLGFSVLSLIVPFINVNEFIETQHLSSNSFIVQLPAINANSVTVNATRNNSFGYWQILYVAYIIVCSLLFLRLLVQLLSIRKIRLGSIVFDTGKVKIYHVSRPILPFSFLNAIYLNTNNYSKDELREIVDHEQVHVRERHTIDVLIAEVLCVLNWFNPFAWLIKNAVRENLEFLADEAVIRKGADKKSYQYLLLKVTGDIPFSITSNLKLSSIKSRILMMNKKRTSGFHLIKFALLVPVIALLLLAFGNGKQAKPQAREFKTVTENYVLNSLTYSIADKKVKAIVLKEKDKSLLKAGDSLDLNQIFNEKARLKNLLERNGYANLKRNAIMFWVDTATVKNSFSIEVKIDVEPPTAFSNRKNINNSQLLATFFEPLSYSQKLTKKFFEEGNSNKTVNNNSLYSFKIDNKDFL